MKTWYWAQARWNSDSDEQYRQSVFCSLADAQAFAVEWGGHDPHALLKVYEGHYDRDGEFMETQDYYWDGKEWTE